MNMKQKIMKQNKSIILLSGGLDSFVSLAIAKKEYNIQKAITFNYGQKAFQKELEASKKICDYFKIEHQVIELDWLSNIINKDEIWVPNRNALFLNIAGSFAEAKNFTHIIFGANAQEAENFSDNTEEFVSKINKVFEFSTKTCPKVHAPLLKLNKQETVKIALDLNLPLNLVYSCYEGDEKNCGKCPSCMLLKEALLKNSDNYFIKSLF